VEDDGLVGEGDEGLGVGEGEGTETGTKAARVRSGISLHASRDAVQDSRGYGNTGRRGEEDGPADEDECLEFSGHLDRYVT
jgi:hypothetical protein